jgi:hypothetical protein
MLSVISSCMCSSHVRRGCSAPAVSRIIRTIDLRVGGTRRLAGGAGMTARHFALIALSALAATSASAQSIGTQRSPPDLAGLYRCVRNCAGVGPAQISQRGWDLFLTNENGQTAQAWIAWPGHIKSQSWDDCAVYSPNGFTIQFNRGAVWVLVDPMMGGGWKQW